MSTPDMQLVSRVIRGGREAFNAVIRWGITADDFSVTEAKSLWEYIVGFHRSPGSKGSVIGTNTIQHLFPTFVICDDDGMSTEALCRLLRDKRLIQQIKVTSEQAITNADLNPAQAATYVQQAMSRVLELGSNKGTDVTFASAFTEIINDYVMGEQGIVTAAATWPWPSLQEATGGIQKDDYIVFYGRPKSMKSWVLCALVAELFLSGKKILLYTKEMTPKNIYKRIASVLAGVPYSEFRKCALSLDEKQRLYEAFDMVSKHSDQVICLSGRDVPQGGDTVAWFRSKAEYYQPDICAIDGMYLMSSGGGARQADHIRMMNISREVSQMRLDLEIPVIATVQANRKAASHSNAELDEIAYSDAIGQDATIAARVINEKGKPTIALVIGGSREFQLHGIRIGGVPSTDFFEKEKLTEKEINKAKEGDTGDEDESPDAHAKIRTPRVNKNAADQNKLIEQHMRNV